MSGAHSQRHGIGGSHCQRTLEVHHVGEHRRRGRPAAGALAEQSVAMAVAVGEDEAILLVARAGERMGERERLDPDLGLDRSVRLAAAAADLLERLAAGQRTLRLSRRDIAQRQSKDQSGRSQ